MLQAAELEVNCQQFQHPDFVPALASVIEAVGTSKIAMEVARLYSPFIASYKVQLTHAPQHLQWIFRLASKIKGDLNWLKEVEHPALVVVEESDGAFSKHLQYIQVPSLFMSYPQLYSWNYIALMKSQCDASG